MVQMRMIRQNIYTVKQPEITPSFGLTSALSWYSWISKRFYSSSVWNNSAKQDLDFLFFTNVSDIWIESKVEKAILSWIVIEYKQNNSRCKKANQTKNKHESYSFSGAAIVWHFPFRLHVAFLGIKRDKTGGNQHNGSRFCGHN